VAPPTLTAFVVLAAMLRVAVYVANHSLTTDEAFVALNVERRSPAGLAGELDWNQAAPPFVASLVSVVLFERLATQTLERLAAILAVIVFAGFALVTSYGAIAKPYTFDVLAVLLVYLATLKALQDGTITSVLILMIIGIVALSFSYASVFAVLASAIVISVAAGFARRRRELLLASVITVTWSAVLAALYFFRGETVSHLRESLGSQALRSASSLRDVAGNLRQVVGVSIHSNEFGYSSGLNGTLLTVAALAAALFIAIGGFQLLRRDWRTGALLILPAILALVASAAGFYPLFSRAVLFYAPTLAILIAEGFFAMMRWKQTAAVRSVIAVLLGLVLVAEIASTIQGIRTVWSDEGMKPSFEILAQQQRASDVVYVDYRSQYTFAYYLTRRCVGPRFVRGRCELWDVVPISGKPAQWAPAVRAVSRHFRIGKFRGYGIDRYYEDFRRLPKDTRVWIVLSGMTSAQKRLVTARLNNLGRRLSAYHANDGVTTVPLLLYVF
jgi:hypothetical protein